MVFVISASPQPSCLFCQVSFYALVFGFGVALCQFCLKFVFSSWTQNFLIFPSSNVKAAFSIDFHHVNSLEPSLMKSVYDLSAPDTGFSRLQSCPAFYRNSDQSKTNCNLIFSPFPNCVMRIVIVFACEEKHTKWNSTFGSRCGRNSCQLVQPLVHHTDEFFISR